LRTRRRDAWRFCSGGWSRLADLPHPLVASASPAPVAGDCFFLVSGDEGTQMNLASPEDHTGFSKKVLRYDPRRNRWASAGALPVPPPVTVAVTQWKNEFIFFNGEVRPGVRTSQVFSFVPGQAVGTGY
jgi:N-acetylneuraminate epimerase